MDVVVERAGALDIGKKLIVAAIRVPAEGRKKRRQQVRSFGAFESDLKELAEWFHSEGVTDVAMEATGVYWKAPWYALDDAGFNLLLVNPTQVKKVPGRKTDVKDAEWICQLLECGLLNGSFVPPEPIRDLRDHTRYRKKLVQDRSREANRVQKVLEDAGVKMSSVVSDCMGVSGRLMLDALIAGERSPEALANFAKAALKKKIPQLQRAMATARFRDHHTMMLKAHMAHIDHLNATINAIDEQVDEVIAPFASQRDLLITIPGVGKHAAEVIIAEIGVDMNQFPTSGHLASWAGMCPGNNESAGKHLSGRTRSANPWLSGLLTQCGWSARQTRGTYLAAQFWHIAKTRGREKAAVAVGHSVLVIAWHILKEDVAYQDLGGDWFDRRKNPEDQRNRLVQRLESLGYEVTTELKDAS